MQRSLGCFVSSAGGIYKSLANAKALGVNSFMIHPAPPQRWNSLPFKKEDIKKFNDVRETYPEIKKIYFHGIYLINLANPDKQKFHLSKLSLLNHLNLLFEIKAQGLVFHTGSLKDWTDDAQGIERVVYGINWIFENLLANLSASLTLPDNPFFLLECAAGSGKVIGDKMEELADIYSKVDDKYKKYIGFCFDTQHLFASGYNYPANIDNFVDEAERILGLSKIPLVHFNDSKTLLGSNKDRHEDLGKGLIGEDGLKKFLNHPKLKEKDFILETPSLGEFETAKLEVEKLKSWAI